MVLGLKLNASIAGCAGSIPGQETDPRKDPTCHAVWPKTNKQNNQKPVTQNAFLELFSSIDNLLNLFCSMCIRGPKYSAGEWMFGGT